MSARSEIFPDPSAGNEPVVRHLAEVVTIHRGTVKEPAHLDLVALANVIVRSEAQITELALQLERVTMDADTLRHKVEKLERRDARMMDLIRSMLGADEFDDEDDI